MQAHVEFDGSGPCTPILLTFQTLFEVGVERQAGGCGDLAGGQVVTHGAEPLQRFSLGGAVDVLAFAGAAGGRDLDGGLPAAVGALARFGAFTRARPATFAIRHCSQRPAITATVPIPTG